MRSWRRRASSGGCGEHGGCRGLSRRGGGEMLFSAVHGLLTARTTVCAAAAAAPHSSRPAFIMVIMVRVSAQALVLEGGILLLRLGLFARAET